MTYRSANSPSQVTYLTSGSDAKCLNRLTNCFEKPGLIIVTVDGIRGQGNFRPVVYQLRQSHASMNSGVCEICNWMSTGIAVNMKYQPVIQSVTSRRCGLSVRSKCVWISRRKSKYQIGKRHHGVKTSGNMLCDTCPAASGIASPVPALCRYV